MPLEPTFAHREQGRRPLSWAVLSAALAMGSLGVWGGAPWFWFLPIGGALAGALWLLVANPQSACALTADTLRFSACGVDRTVALGDVASMEVQHWSEGPDSVALILKSGERIAIPVTCGGTALVAALERAGIARCESPRHS